MAPYCVNSKTEATLAKPGSLSSRAYVTFLAGNGDYVKGVVGLAKGLKKVKSEYPLVVAVLPDVPLEHRRLLMAHGCIVHEIDMVDLPIDRSMLARDYYALNYSKLRLWEFVEYHKMVYLDGDTQVYDNIDHLFDMPDGNFYGVVDCLCATWGKPCSDRLTWPAELGTEPALYFNAGMFVFEPSLSTYDDLMRTLKVTPPTAFAEQDFLNMFFKDIYKPISPVYNFLIAMLWRHPGIIELDQVKVLHYCVKGSKPWKYIKEEKNMDRDDVRMLVKRWWDVYEDESVASKGPTVDNGAEKYMAVRRPDNDVLQCIATAPSAA